jgi:hypothetical protein
MLRRLLWTAGAVTFLTTGVALLCSEVTVAQNPRPGEFDHPPAKRPQPNELSGTRVAPPEPYGGQIFCPVTGIKLGLNQPPTAVQTTIGEQKPSFFARLFGAKPVAGMVIYVCCPQCAERVRANPEPYLTEIIADRATFTFTYATAPAQRPPRTRPQTAE